MKRRTTLKSQVLHKLQSLGCIFLHYEDNLFKISRKQFKEFLLASCTFRLPPSPEFLQLLRYLPLRYLPLLPM